MEPWAFAADRLAGVADSEITRLFLQVPDARLDNQIGTEKASSVQEQGCLKVSSRRTQRSRYSAQRQHPLDVVGQFSASLTT